MNRRPRLEVIAPSASPEEAAALAAAIEVFMRDSAPVVIEAPAAKQSPWQQAALQEGVMRQPQAPAPWL